MPRERRTFSTTFKLKVALDAIKGLKTVSEIPKCTRFIPPKLCSGSVSFFKVLNRSLTVQLTAKTRQQTNPKPQRSTSKSGSSICSLSVSVHGLGKELVELRLAGVDWVC